MINPMSLRGSALHKMLENTLMKTGAVQKPFVPANPEQASWAAGTTVAPKGAFAVTGVDGNFKGLTDKGKEALTGATGAFGKAIGEMEAAPAMQAADPHSDPTNAQYWAQIQAQRQKQIPRKTGGWI